MFYRNWKLRRIRKRIKKGVNHRSLKDMKQLVSLVHEVPLKTLCSVRPEHRGFVKITTHTATLLHLRKAANASLLELTNYDNLEALFRDYCSRSIEQRTLASYLGQIVKKPSVFYAKVDDVTRTLELICKTIEGSENASYLFRVHEPMFEDYLRFIKALIAKGVVDTDDQ